MSDETPNEVVPPVNVEICPADCGQEHVHAEACAPGAPVDGEVPPVESTNSISVPPAEEPKDDSDQSEPPAPTPPPVAPEVPESAPSATPGVEVKPSEPIVPVTVPPVPETAPGDDDDSDDELATPTQAVREVLKELAVVAEFVSELDKHLDGQNAASRRILSLTATLEKILFKK